ncbi:MAG: circularly permuted type 2 ATP-grasp protein [Leptospira sp.]|nr:circularly permuted type 2 ATP-grasp protein [Leptospira sp.]
MEKLNLIQNYEPLPSTYDELVDENGVVREKYNFLLKSFQELGQDELKQRNRDSERILQENGVTYNIYSDDAKQERAWALDLFPVLIESEEWRKVERGLDQRGELFDCIVRDLYGPRRIIKEKRIPSELIWACPGFLRACDGMFAKTKLNFFASDLVRNKSGDFLILNDRIQAPSGSGYSLENRIVLSRIFPSIYRDSQVHRIASYFRILRKNLQNVSGIEGRDPVIALLTPGPGNETYFEHAYLASYLGYTLVQGEDLTVRSNIVYMKTVEGLQRVDVILKRVDDVFMDSLELKGDSLLGVPGLLEAVRGGSVRVANSIGSSILENRALFAYMNELCRYYLGEELILPTVTTRWLGKPEDLSFVMREPEEYIYKPVFPTIGEHSYLPRYLTEEENSVLFKRIQAQPEKWIAQEIVDASTIPVYTDNGLVPGKAIYRTFITASDSGYHTMAGGLVRVTTDLEEVFITNQRGAFSKDLWILATESQKEESIVIPSKEKISVSRAAMGVPSRVADNLYWFARYAERSENTARLIREAIKSVLEFNENSEESSQETSLKLLSFTTYSYPGFLGDDSGDLFTNPYPEIYKLLYDVKLPGSMNSNLQSLSVSAKNVRDRLSDDTRRIIKSLENMKNVGGKNYDLMLDDIFQVIILLTSLTGLSFENLSREAGWYFLEMGRRIERAYQIIRLIQGIIQMGDYERRKTLNSLLNVSDIRITYRRRYRYKMDIETVLDILLFDETNPRSLGYQLTQLYENIKFLPGKSTDKNYPEDRIALDLYTNYKLKDIGLLMNEGSLNEELISGWLNLLLERIKNLSDSITKRYFNYAENQTSLGG